MSSYDYSIMYKPGRNIAAADTMSRFPLQENLQVPTLGCTIHLMDHLDDTTVDYADIHIYQPLRSGRIWHKVNF